MIADRPQVESWTVCIAYCWDYLTEDGERPRAIEERARTALCCFICIDNATEWVNACLGRRQRHRQLVYFVSATIYDRSTTTTCAYSHTPVKCVQKNGIKNKRKKETCSSKWNREWFDASISVATISRFSLRRRERNNAKRFLNDASDLPMPFEMQFIFLHLLNSFIYFEFCVMPPFLFMDFACTVAQWLKKAKVQTVQSIAQCHRAHFMWKIKVIDRLEQMIFHNYKILF